MTRSQSSKSSKSSSSSQSTGSQRRRTRRAWTAEFKQEAVRLMQTRRAAGVSVAQVGRELDVRPDQLRRWAHELNGRRAAGAVAEETPDQELRRLRREVDVLRQERDFAKKAAVFFAKESR
jgi:transposase